VTFKPNLYNHIHTPTKHYYNPRSLPMAISESIIVSESLPTIHLDLLRAENDTESKKLLSACRTQGFFYLDLTSDPELCKLWEGMLARMKDYFEQPLEVKMQDARGSDNYGRVHFHRSQLGLCYQLLTFLATYPWAPNRAPSQKQKTATKLSRYGILFYNLLNLFSNQLIPPS
jgi:hypothetical protein